MAVRWSRLAPQLALTPALAVTLVGFVGSIGWTVYMSFTRSRRFPDYAIDPDAFGQYKRLFGNPAWTTALENLVVLALGSALAIVFGFVLAAMVEREKRGEGFFRTVFLYPLAISLIVTGLVWRWMFNPSLGIEAFLRQHGFPGRALQLAGGAGDRDVRDHPRLDLARARLLHGADAGGPEVDQHRDLERRPPRRGELLAALRRDHHPDDEVHLPHLRDPALARGGQGLRHRGGDVERGAGHLDLDAGLLRDQRLFHAQQHRLRLGGRGHHAPHHACHLPAAGAPDRLAGAAAGGGGEG